MPFTTTTLGEKSAMTRNWFWKIIRLTVLVLLIAGLVDVILIAGRHCAAMFNREKPSKQVLNSPMSEYSIPQPKAPSASVIKGPYDSLINDPNTHNKSIATETIVVDITPERIFARYEVYLPKDHPLFEVVETAYGARTADRLVTDVLGPVKLGSDFLEFQPTETSVAPGDPNAHFYVTSQSIRPTRHQYRIQIEYPYKEFNLRIEKREVVVKTKGAQIWSDYQSTPYSKTTEQTTFVRPANQNSLDFHVYFPEGTPIQPESIPNSPPAPSLGDILSQGANPPGLGTILFGLLAALPFLLFLYWTQKYGFEEKQPGFRLKVEAIQIYLALHFTPYLVLALRDLTERWGNPTIIALRSLQRLTIAVFDIPSSHEHEVLLPLMVMFVCIWPAMVVRWERREAEREKPHRGRASQILFIVTLFALVAWAGTSIYQLRKSGFANVPVRDFYGFLFSVLLLGLMGACAWLAFEVFDRRRMRATLLMFSVFVVFLAAKTGPYHAFVQNTWKAWIVQNAIGMLVFIVTAFMLVSSFGRLTYRVVSGNSVFEEWNEWSSKKRTLLVLTTLFISISTVFWPADFWRLSSLAFELRYFFLAVLVWILVDFLKYKCKDSDWLNLPQSTRRAGILLALVTFYSSTNRWNFIPVAFLVGFILLDKWLLPTKHYDKSLFSEIKGQLPKIIQKIIDFNDAEKSLGSLKKELLNKVGKGELTHAEYLKKLKSQSEAVEELEQDLTIRGRFAKQVVLAFGPTDSAWDNGKKTALYSLLFSAPWALLFLRDIVRAPAFSGSYLIIHVITSVGFLLLPWVSYGFVFGYFYPYIKGNNGIRKAVSLFMTIVIPKLVWTSLARPLESKAWFLFGFWVLQVFVHTMLLGLVAGDYETLRKAGFKWKDLLEIHRAGALSAWASSLLIAVGAAVTALISGGAAQLIAAAFKFTAANIQSATGN